jgi:hypothetical protein
MVFVTGNVKKKKNEDHSKKANKCLTVTQGFANDANIIASLAFKAPPASLCCTTHVTLHCHDISKSRKDFERRGTHGGSSMDESDDSRGPIVLLNPYHPSDVLAVGFATGASISSTACRDERMEKGRCILHTRVRTRVLVIM